MKLKVQIGGNEWGDLEMALEEVAKLIREEYRFGNGTNKSGWYHFDVEGSDGRERLDRIDRKMIWLGETTPIAWIAGDPLHEPISILLGSKEAGIEEKPMMFDSLDDLEEWIDDELAELGIEENVGWDLYEQTRGR
jgi:hypothetical protein